ncbi:hypothetical protein QVG61_08130 [Thiohalobacter sp. IOR34]|uniref:hypothetical protein n=1 Tax=Thiohalobacter sp. IOR34 TaxID=3057176 RepID=UPI0025B02BBD|nr:hypothetical protein [Thiohalobacter sp. IOR34]WJW74486.1 hypothetical protein QVG61_08130 [Thiohalobacter sp. IOR34]
MNRQRLGSFLTAGLLAAGLWAAPVGATLLGVSPGEPTAIYGSLRGEGLNFDAASGSLTASGTPLAMVFGGTPVRFGPGAALSLGFRLDNMGQVTGGRVGNDFELLGRLDLDGDGTPEYSGMLLSGEILKFGYLDLTATIDAMDFLFSPTGGALAGDFAHSSIAVSMLLENSTFAGSFASDFSSSRIKGKVGPGGLPPQRLPEPATFWLLAAGLPLLSRRHR